MSPILSNFMSNTEAF